MNFSKKNVTIFVLLSFSYVASSDGDAGTQTSAEVHGEYRSRIVGGERVSHIIYYPFMAYLHLGSDHCAGTIIDKNWILSSAHCSRETMSVYVGSVRGRAGRRYEVEEQIIHARYSRSKHDGSHFDLMLVKLKSSIIFTDTVQQIALGTAEHIVDGHMGIAVGYGTSSANASYDGVLRAMTLPMMTADTCLRQHYTNHFSKLPSLITQTFFGKDVFCAGANDTKKGNCYGDYGGGFVAEAEGTLIGVASLGTCGSGMYPDIYVSVPFFRDWISFETGIK